MKKSTEKIKKSKITVDPRWFFVVYTVMMRKLFKEVREINRKMNLPIKRSGSRGRLVPVEFTEREKYLIIEMLTRRSKRHPIKNDRGHIFAPMKMNKHE